MENNKPTTGKVALKYGIILGLIGIAFNLMLYFQDLHYQIDMSRIFLALGLGVVLTIIASILGILEFRKANNGFVSFPEGLKIGVGATLISGVIGIIFGFVLAHVIDPDMTAKAIEYSTNMMLDSGMDPEMVEKQIESQKDPNYVFQIAGGLIFNLFIGFVGALIPALALKKSEPQY